MALKQFEIRYIDGAGDLKEDLFTAKSKQQARSQLLQDTPGLVILNITKKSRLYQDFKKSLQPKINNKDALQFTSHLQSLAQAGISIVDCLTIMENLVNKKALKHYIRSLISKLKQGYSFSEALNELPDLYSSEFVALIKAGEKVGRLDDILKTLYGLLKWDQDLSAKVMKAFRYPLIVISVGTLSLIGVFTFIIPKFQTFFTTNKVELPFITKILLAISSFMTENIGLLFMIACLIAVAIYVSKKTKKLDQYVDKLILKIPLFGDLYKRLIVSKSMKIFSILYENGVSVLESTKIIAPLSTNAVFQNDLSVCFDKIKQGFSLEKACTFTYFFDGLANQMIGIGESSGNLGAMLDKTSQLYKDLVDQTLEQIFTYIEPLLIGIIGLLVLALALGIFSPMVNMMSIMGAG